MSLALPKTWRITLLNGTGQTCNPVSAIAVFDRPGILEPEEAKYSAAQTLIDAVSINNAEYASSDAIKNDTANGSHEGGNWWGAAIQVSVIENAGAPTGNVSVYLDFSNDGGTTWDTTGQGKLLGSVPITAQSATVVVKTFYI